MPPKNHVRKSKTGRPTAYDPDKHLPIVKRCRMAGFTEDEVAMVLQIGRSTLHVWQKKHPEFRDAIKKDPLEAAGEVAASLFKRATGYEVTEEKVVGTKDKQTGAFSADKIERTRKHFAPDVIACIFWLKNRAPQHWKDRVAVDVSNKDPATLFGADVRDLPMEVLASMIEREDDPQWRKVLTAVKPRDGKDQPNSHGASSHEGDSSASPSTPSPITSPPTT